MEKNDRFDWALAIMSIQPNHHILEIGCGVGFAVEKMAPLLKKGGITAIDKSPAAIEKATKRNAAAIQQKKVELLTKELLQLTDDNKLYDKIFCFNVNLFWTKQSVTKEAGVIKHHLKKNGLLYIFYGPLFGGGIHKIEGPVTGHLEQEDFVIQEVIHDRKVNCCCFVARMA